MLHRLRHTGDGRRQPQIPVAPVAVSLFLGALLGLSSYLKLAKKSRKKTWQRLMKHAAGLNHEVFNYVSEFLSLDDLREHLYVVAQRATPPLATGAGGMRQVVELQASSVKSLLYIWMSRLAVILGGGCAGRPQPSCANRSCWSFSGCV